MLVAVKIIIELFTPFIFPASLSSHSHACFLQIPFEEAIIKIKLFQKASFLPKQSFPTEIFSSNFPSCFQAHVQYQCFSLEEINYSVSESLPASGQISFNKCSKYRYLLSPLLSQKRQQLVNMSIYAISSGDFQKSLDMMATYKESVNKSVENV